MNAASAPSRDELRRGWCPATLRPMETGDGLLVRLHPPGAVLTPEQLRQVAALAARHGNGQIEISARANLQIRGVTAASHPPLVEDLLAAGVVDERDDGGPSRITLTSPLAGRPEDGPLDAAALAGAIEARARAITGLPTKLLVVVEGGAFPLDRFKADLRLCALAKSTVALGLPDGRWFGPLSVSEALDATGTLLTRLAREGARHLRDLPAAALTLDLPAMPKPAERASPRRVGLFGASAIAGLPFGRCDAATLDRLAAAATEAGAPSLRLSPWRGVACLDAGADGARRWLDAAQALGLVVEDADPRLAVETCSGRPACARGEVETVADATRLARAVAGLPEGLRLHLSGCIKGCAHAGPAALTLVGRAGRYDVVLDGGTRDAPSATLDLSEILARLQPGGALRRHLEHSILRSE